ncbi:uncharacterized protein TRAVEDRAFT_134901, partial [Trametes versicolor FP-101664 SS1]|uniref:uncharacterized protein n=1 Tax=Trametes versicolor (strain FP-101664) TaxID=717944 RepID=UPI00046248D2
MFAGRVKIFASAHPEAPTQKEGVAIVLNKKIVSADNTTCREIVPGRALQLTMPWRGGEVRQILCVYALTSDGVAERKAFFVKLRDFYENNPEVPKPHLMAGDFNNVEDQIDRIPVAEAARDASVDELDNLKCALGLMERDGWRATYPSGRDYTFQRKCGDRVQMSRLDRIYVTADLMRWAREWASVPVGVKTDHSMVSVLLTAPNEPEVGKGRPLFPLHLLKDKTLAKKMKESGHSAIRELKNIQQMGRTHERNPQTVLSNLKKEWMSEAREREKRIVPKL